MFINVYKCLYKFGIGNINAWMLDSINVGCWIGGWCDMLVWKVWKTNHIIHTLNWVLFWGGSIGGSSTALLFSKWSFFIIQPVQVLFYILPWNFGFTFYMLKETNFTVSFYQGNLTYEVPCYRFTFYSIHGIFSTLQFTKFSSFTLTFWPCFHSTFWWNFVLHFTGTPLLQFYSQNFGHFPFYIF